MNVPVKLEECSWPQVRAALGEGYDTVVVTTASVEQHGPHLPILTDTLIGEALGEGIAACLGNAFSAPVIRPGLSEHHMAFPGSFTLSPETFLRVLEECCLSLARHGFRYLVADQQPRRELRSDRAGRRPDPGEDPGKRPGRGRHPLRRPGEVRPPAAGISRRERTAGGPRKPPATPTWSKRR